MPSIGHDNLHRRCPSGDSPSSLSTFGYDNPDRQIASENPLGFRWTTGYDALGPTHADGRRRRVDGVELHRPRRGAAGEPSRGYILTREYDAVGNRIVLVDPDSGRFTYGYNALDRVRFVQDPDGVFTTVSYDPNGNRSLMQDGNGTSREYGYDALDRQTSQIEHNSGGATLLRLTDTYDAVGNRVRYERDGEITTWSYDALYRLTGQEKLGETGTYAYDPAGNLTLKWEQGSAAMQFTVDAANRLVTMTQGANLTTFLFDANGNQVEEDLLGAKTTYVYDQANRLVRVLNPDGTRSTYTYAGDGLRRSAQEPGEALTTFIWDGDDYLMEKT